MSRAFGDADEIPKSPYLVGAERIKDLCRIGEGAATCRYLCVGGAGFECAKHQQGLARQINSMVSHGMYTAKGDNCEGIKSDDD